MLGAVPQQNNTCAPLHAASAADFAWPVPASLLIALPLAGLLWTSGAVSLFTAIAAMTVFVFVVMAAGSVLLRAAGAHDMPAAATWVAGVFATAIAMSVLVIAFQLLAAWAFGVWSGLVLALAAFMRRRAPAPRQLSAVEGAGLLLCGLATVYWCRELAEAPAILLRDGVLTTWTDQFIHGGAISQFGDPRAAGRGAIEIAGLPRPFYHYATYMLPAALAWPLDLPGLSLALSLWVPLGFLTLCAGAYALGDTLAGAAGGLAGLALLTVIPDAASYGLHNRLFGYYWYVLAVPGASYAVGIGLLSMALLRRFLKTGNSRALLASAALVAGLLVIRVHLFVLALPAWLACLAMSSAPLRERKLAFGGGALLGFAALVWGFYTVFPELPHALALFLDVAHNQQSPTAYPGVYERLLAFHGPQVAVPAGVVLVLGAFLGVFVLLYPLSQLLLRRVRALETMDAMPVLLLACYVLLILTAPVPPHGDATEFTQRPFVLVYAAIAVWTGAGFAAWALSRGGLRDSRVRLALAVVAALTVMGVLLYTVRDWRWSYRYKVAEGLPHAAAFVRSRSAPGDLIAAQGLNPGLVTTDLAVQLVSMTGVPAYLARPFMHTARGGIHGDAAVRRYRELGAVQREQNAIAALAALRRLGIRWYVVAESNRAGPTWDPERRHAAYVDRMVAVYDAGTQPK